jgi:hypothetical protein
MLHKSSRKVPVISHILIKFVFSSQLFEKSRSTKFQENPFTKAELFHTDGHTYTHDKAASQFSQFLERGYDEPTNVCFQPKHCTGMTHTPER